MPAVAGDDGNGTPQKEFSKYKDSQLFILFIAVLIPALYSFPETSDMIIPTDPVSGPKTPSDPRNSPSAPCEGNAPSGVVGDEAGENVGFFSSPAMCRSSHVLGRRAPSWTIYGVR